MASIEKTIEIIFGAQDRNVRSTIRDLETSFNTFGDNFGSVAGQLSDVTEKALKTEAAIIALAAAYGGYAVSEAIKFQDAQIDLKKVLDDTDPSVESFTQTVTDLSERYGVAADSILKGIANFKQAGFTAEEAATLQKNALDLVIAGDVGATQATEILVASLKGFDAQAEDSARFIEALNNVSNQYATDLGELATGMAGISPVAKTMGFTFEETTGLITPVIEVFRSGNDAATALKTGLLKLVDDAKPVREALASIGISQFDLNGNMRSGKDIFYDVAEAFKTLDENQKLVVTSQLVGIDQAAKMVTVFDNLAKVQGVTATAMAETGSAIDEVNLRLDSAGKQVDKAVVVFNNLARSVGTELLPSFGDVSAGATTLLQAFRDIVESGGLAPLFDALDGQGAEIRAFFEEIAQALPEAFEGLDFKGLLDSFGNLRDSIGRLFGDLDLTRPDDLQQALQKLIDFMSLLTNASAGAVQGIEPLVDGIVTLLTKLADSDSETQTFIGNIGGIATTVDKLIPLLGILGDALGVVGGALGVLAATRALGTLSSLNTALTGISPTAVPLAAAIAAVTFAIHENIEAYDDYQQRQQAVADTEQHINETRASIADRLHEISEATGLAVTSMDDLNQAQQKGLIVFDEATGTYVKAGQTAQDLADAFKDVGLQLDPVSGSIIQLGNASGRTDEEIDALLNSIYGISTAASDVVGSFQSLAEAESAALGEIDKGKTTSITFADGMYQLHASNKAVVESSQEVAVAVEDTSMAMVKGSAEWKRVHDVLLETTQQANDFKIEMGKLANERYEINVNAAVDLQVAQIEADTKRISSAFDATASSISSLTEGVTDLWGSFSKATGFSTKWALEDAAKRMEDRLDKELELKQQLTEAIVSQSLATTQRLLSGEPIIQIDGGSLAPELEMIFDKILEYTQIRASNEGLSLLMGI